MSMHPRLFATITTAVAAVVVAHEGLARAGDPFAYLASSVVIEPSDRLRLEQGEVVVQVLPGRDGELGVFAAARLDATADALVVWTRAIADLKKSPYVLAIRRFSDPPRLEDLNELALDGPDLDALRRCRPGDCDLRLGAEDIASLREAVDTGGIHWTDAVQLEFRRAVLRRVNLYREGGLSALPPYADRRAPTGPREAFETILLGSQYLGLPGLVARLRNYPRVEFPVVDSFFYWSKEQYGSGKRVISVTHVEIVRPGTGQAQEVMVLGKEILATHYRNASLGTTAIVRDPSGQKRYLVYINRSHVDLFGGLFGGFKRKLVEGRLKAETAGIVKGVRDRLSGGEPGANLTLLPFANSP